MNFMSASTAETISRTPPTQIVQCNIRMPWISNISSFWKERGIRLAWGPLSVMGHYARLAARRYRLKYNQRLGIGSQVEAAYRSGF